MDSLFNLLPAVPGPVLDQVLDQTNPYQNVTFLLEMFVSSFLGTFIASLAGQTVRGILGESAILGHLVKPVNQVLYDKES